MQIRYSLTATKALRRCDKRVLIREKIEQLSQDPSALSANVKKLSGREDYRLRVQNWRVLFRFGDGVLEIDDVLPRGSAYED
ncbi:MAG: addiction module toxin RelE [Novosphingobium sp. 28-62-57]|uniref:type II toxin-antitoxin system RelE family toxin n=1 Tax=unclassified Novosphingobium TaxID=2644732 RepID=UPI000BCF3D33|nr:MULTISPECIES: type II toxin-antitoxin system RelE/ParE family toxin [unclassified Novosphingobium]OYW48115.1 MAG: addiction module toxin RelE [Novosphingobium sp. 12-63-9]OYZ08599.1 MAG: addiction module toxin RelE [Novosphingobium sp. 28-62-57]OZA31709.1 MAG: addiction module toxin RelE [Novosphingobium sp. 17-62-9]HQS71304.1 type II toxin-antitoxin system RelE/ParE family toxin [Novosphingobium sp.]